MGTCFCRIEGRCLNKREFVFHTLNNNYQQWKEDNIPQSSKSPLEWRFSGLFGWRRTDGFASARLKGWKDTIADIKGVSDIWALALCPNTDTLLYPLFDIAFSMTKDIGNPMPLPCLIVAHQGQIHWIISSFADSRHQVSNILLYLHWTRARARIQGHIFNESVFTLSLLEIWQFQMRKDNDDYALTLYSDIRCTPHQSRYGCGVWYRLFSHGFCQNL